MSQSLLKCFACLNATECLGTITLNIFFSVDVKQVVDTKWHADKSKAVCKVIQKKTVCRGEQCLIMTGGWHDDRHPLHGPCTS